MTSAQKSVTREDQMWFGAFNQTRISKRWGTWTDVHFRLKNDFIQDPSQFLLRLGPTFYFSDNVRFTVAYNLINHYPDETHPEISVVEHRPFQQLQWYTRFSKTKLMQWIRLDERFRPKIDPDGLLAGGYDFNWRLRYNYALFIPLTRKGLTPGGFQFLVNDEIMVNFGKKIVFNYFDQNRLFAGLVYQITRESHVQLGYMNVFQQQISGNKYRLLHCIRAFYFHNFDWRKNHSH